MNEPSSTWSSVSSNRNSPPTAVHVIQLGLVSATASMAVWQTTASCAGVATLSGRFTGTIRSLSYASRTWSVKDAPTGKAIGKPLADRPLVVSPAGT